MSDEDIKNHMEQDNKQGMFADWTPGNDKLAEQWGPKRDQKPAASASSSDDMFAGSGDFTPTEKHTSFSPDLYVDTIGTAVLLTDVHDTLDDDDRAWVKDNEEMLKRAVQEGRIDQNRAQKLGLTNEPQQTTSEPPTRVSNSSGGIDQGNTRPVAEDNSNWYVDLARSPDLPQTADYWKGNRQKGIASKIDELRAGGMQEDEINRLTGGRDRAQAAPRQPDIAPHQPVRVEPQAARQQARVEQQQNPDQEERNRQSRFEVNEPESGIDGLDNVLEGLSFNQLTNALTQLEGNPQPRIAQTSGVPQEGEQSFVKIFRFMNQNGNVTPETVRDILNRKIEHRVRIAERLGMLENVYGKVSQLDSRVQNAKERPLTPVRKEELSKLKDEISTQELFPRNGKLVTFPKKGEYSEYEQKEAESIARYSLNESRGEIINRAEQLYREAINQTNEKLMDDIPDNNIDLLVEGIAEVSPEAQRARTRAILNKLESRNQIVGSQADTRLRTVLKEMKRLSDEGKISPEVNKELNVRLALHDTNLVISSLPRDGKAIVDRAGVFSQGENSAYSMRPNHYDILAHETGLDRNGLAFGGIPVYDAYMLLQSAATEGWMLNGANIRLYKKSPTSGNDDAIKNQIASRLGENGAKAVELAERWATCNLTKFTWMRDGNHPIAQLIHFENARMNGEITDSGNQFTLHEIPSLLTDMIRDGKYKPNPAGPDVRVYRDDLFQQADRLVDGSENDQLRAVTVLRRRNGITYNENPDDNRERVDQIDPRSLVLSGKLADNVQESMVKKIGSANTLQEWALKSIVRPNDINADNLIIWHKAIKNADPRGIYNTRFALIGGMVASGLKEFQKSQWDRTNDVLEVQRVLLQTVVDTKGTKQTYFFDQQQLLEIKKKYQPIAKNIGDDFWKALTGIIPVQRN